MSLADLNFLALNGSLYIAFTFYLLIIIPFDINKVIYLAMFLTKYVYD